MNEMNITAGTIARTACLALALTNQILSAMRAASGDDYVTVGRIAKAAISLRVRSVRQKSLWLDAKGRTSKNGLEKFFLEKI